MRVLFLQRQPCIRALKYAFALRERGVRLAFAASATLNGLYGEGDELFEEWHPLGDDPAAALTRAVERFRPDLVHSHNLPDSLTVMAQESLGGRVPILHDVHDLQSLRRTPYEDGFPQPGDPIALERRAVEGSDALVTVSPELLAEIAARYRLPADTLVFPNYALRRDAPARIAPPPPGDGRPRLVYQGSLGVDGGHYDLREILRRLAAGGATVDAWAVRHLAEYRDIARRTPGLRVHERVEPHVLMTLLPRHDWGWAGFNDDLNAAHLDTVLPNKAFEYLAGGLPIATLRHRALAGFVTSEGVGVSLETPDDVARQLAEHDLPTLRRSVAGLRGRLTVEANIGRMLGLYRDVTGTAGARSMTVV